MAQEDVELREAPSTSQSSVVDDFLAALFARPATKEQEEKNTTSMGTPASTKSVTTTTNVTNAVIASPSIEQSQQRPLQSEQAPERKQQAYQQQTQSYQGKNDHTSNSGVKRDRTPDEFDEYEMLSKRKHGSRATNQENGTGAMINSSNITLAANDSSIARFSTTPASNIDNTRAGDGMNRSSSSTRANVMTEETSHHHHGNRHNMINNDTASGRMGIITSPSSSRPQRDRDQVIPDARMVVRGLPQGSKKREILDYFSKYGPILDAYFKDTAGFIQFDTRDACMDAYLSENGNYFRGSQLELSFSGPRRRDQKPRRGGGVGDDEYRPIRGNKRFQNENRSARKFDEYESDRNSSNRRFKAFPSTSPTRVNNNTSTNGYRNNSPQRSHRFDSYENVSNNNVDHYDNRYNSPTRGDTRMNNGRGNNAMSGNNFGVSDGNGLNRRTWRDEMDTGITSNGGRTPLRGNDHYQPTKHDIYRPSSSTTTVHHHHQQKQPSPHSAANNHQTRNETPTSILPKRTGSDIPLVQIVAWDNVSSSYTDFIERSFRVQRIPIHTLHLQYGQISREEVVSHLMMEGVRALLVVDNTKQAQGRIYLQVFEPNEEAGDGSFRFDEYDSISVEEAIAVMQRTVAQQQQRNQTYPLSQTPVQPRHESASIQPVAATQASYASTPAAPSPMAAMPAIDPNTLSSLITLVKGMMQQQQQQPLQQQQQQTYTPPVNPIPVPPQPQQQQQKPEQPTSLLSNPALANIPPALLNSPAVQQLLATMNQNPVPNAPVVTSVPTNRNTIESYSVPTSQSGSVNTGSYYSNNYSQRSLPPQQPGNVYSQQMPSSSTVVNENNNNMNVGGSSSLEKNDTNINNATTITTTTAAAAINGNNSSNSNNTLGNLPIGDILDKIQMFTQQQQQQSPLPQRQ